MVENARPIVYVSYAYDAEERTSLLEGLKTVCDEQGFDLRCDKEKVRYGESFNTFMGEIGRSRHVVVIASPEYFTSFYCMAELSKICREGSLTTRVIPIWLDNINPNQTPHQSDVIAYWKKVQSELEETGQCAVEAATLEGTKQITGALQSCLEHFGSLRALPHEEYDFNDATERDNFFSKFSRRILFPLEANKNKGIRRCADSQFQKDLIDKVRELLENAPSAFKTALIDELDKNAEIAVADLAKKLCELADDDCFELIDYTLYDAVKIAHKQCEGDHKSNLIETAKEIVSCLVLFSVEEDWLEDWSAESQLTNMRMDLELDTNSAGLIVTSRLHQKVPKFHWETGTTYLKGKDEFTVPAKPSSTDAKHNVDMVIQHIWNEVNPEESDKSLQEDDIAELNRQLERLYRRDLKQHYVCNTGAEFSYLAEPNVLHGIQKYLPALVILLLEDKSGTTQVAIHNDRQLTGALRDFLKHVHELGNNV